MNRSSIQRINDVAYNLNSEQGRVSKRTLNSGTVHLGKRQKTSRSTSPPNSTTSRDEEPSPKKHRRTPDINDEYIPDKTPLKTEYHRKKTKKNVFDMLYFLNFMIKLNMTLVVYAVATFFDDACIIFFACRMGCMSVVIVC